MKVAGERRPGVKLLGYIICRLSMFRQEFSNFTYLINESHAERRNIYWSITGHKEVDVRKEAGKGGGRSRKLLFMSQSKGMKVLRDCDV